MIFAWVRRRLPCRRIYLRYWCYRRPLVTFAVLAVLIVGLQIALMVVLGNSGSGEGVQLPPPRNRVEKVVQQQRSRANKQLPPRPRGKILGVPSFMQDKYFPDSEGFWSCLHSNQTIQYNKVNDDYCDCSDGTDEPSTSGCSGAGGQFYCNDHTAIPASRVNDGICDCCEGTDEYRGRIVIRGVGLDRQHQLGLHLPPCQNYC